jgi:hypothetical protein
VPPLLLVPDTRKAHIRSFAELEQPQSFDIWVANIDTAVGVEEMKAFWLIESLYSVVAPIEEASFIISKARTVLQRCSGERGRFRQSQWSSRANLKALQVDMVAQKAVVEKVLNDYVETFNSATEQHLRSLRDERSGIDTETLREYEIASEDRKVEILRPLWDVATGMKDPKVWEESWHRMKMKEIRAITGVHLTQPIEDAHQKLSHSSRTLQRALGIRLNLSP